MNKLAKIMTFGVGLTGVLSALGGLLYNFMSMAVMLSGALTKFHEEQGLEYFSPAFYTMSFICIGCYILLLICGVDLLFIRFRCAFLLTEVLVFEVIYFFAIGKIACDPTIGRSVCAGLGVANGGMMFQFLVLYPLWGPIALWWAKETLKPSQPAV